MKMEKQLKVLECLNSGLYIVKGDKILNRRGKEIFNYVLPSGYKQCILYNGNRNKGSLKVVVYKHIAIYLHHFGCYNWGKVIAHKDLNKLNNSPGNLVAVSQSENILMSKTNRTGIVLKRLTIEQKETILQLGNDGLNQSQISKKLGINRTVVRYTLLNFPPKPKKKIQKVRSVIFD